MDVGNTNVKVGLFGKNDTEAMNSWRVSTLSSRTADEFGMVLYDLFKNVGVKFSDIKGIIISSVAPSLNYTIEHMCNYYIGLSPVFVDSTTDTGIKIRYDHASELGADRIVDSAAGFAFYGAPCVVVDFGSATTFNVVDAEGTFLGGAIAPGIKTAAESLINTAAKLPRIELLSPKSVIATNTVEGMQSGIIYGYTGLVHYILKRIRTQEGLQNAKVIATGGLSALIEQTEPELFDVTDRALALKGLKMIYERISKKN